MSASQKKSNPTTNKLPKWYWLLPALVGLLLYANTYNHAYVLDDGLVIGKNSYIQKGFAGIADLAIHTYTHGFQGFNDGLYRPLSTITFAMEYGLVGGLNPSVSHVVNMLLFGLTVLVLLLFLRALFPKLHPVVPFLMTLLFAVHPIHTEVVSNIKSRDEILALLTMLAALYFLIKNQVKPEPKLLIASLVLFALGLLSKESSVSFAAIVPLVLYYRFPKMELVGIAKKTAPYLAMAAGFIALRFAVVNGMERAPDSGAKSVLANSLFADMSGAEQLASRLWLQVLYIWKTIVPLNLSHDYTFDMIPAQSLASWQFVVAILAIGGLGYVGVKGLMKRTPWALGIWWFAITLVIVSNLLLRIGTTFAERFLYAPSIGFAIAIPLVLAFVLKLNLEGSKKSIPDFLKGNAAYTGVLAVVIVLFAYKTFDRNTDWENNMTLYRADISYAQNSARANYNLGTALMESLNQPGVNPSTTGKEAVQYLEKAIAIYPEYWDAYNNLGLSYKGIKNYAASIQAYNAVLQRNPDYTKAHYNLGQTYFTAKQHQNAISSLQRYLQYQPNHQMSYYLIGMSYGSLNQFDQARQALEQSLALNPNHASTLFSLGQTYGISGDNAKAFGYFERALQLDPNNMEVTMNAGISQAKMGKHAAAIPYFERVVTQQPNNKGALSNIIQSYQQLGDQAKAAAYQQRLAALQ